MTRPTLAIRVGALPTALPNQKSKGKVLLFPPRTQNGAAEQYAVESESAASFDTTAELREYFGATR